jgi:hypothetical protein
MEREYTIFDLYNVKFTALIITPYIGKFFGPQICADLQPDEPDQICGPANERRRFFF